MCFIPTLWPNRRDQANEKWKPKQRCPILPSLLLFWPRWKPASEKVFRSMNVIVKNWTPLLWFEFFIPSISSNRPQFWQKTTKLWYLLHNSTAKDGLNCQNGMHNESLSYTSPNINREYGWSCDMLPGSTNKLLNPLQVEVVFCRQQSSTIYYAGKFIIAVNSVKKFLVCTLPPGLWQP